MTALGSPASGKRSNSHTRSKVEQSFSIYAFHLFIISFFYDLNIAQEGKRRVKENRMEKSDRKVRAGVMHDQ